MLEFLKQGQQVTNDDTRFFPLGSEMPTNLPIIHLYAAALLWLQTRNMQRQGHMLIDELSMRVNRLNHRRPETWQFLTRVRNQVNFRAAELILRVPKFKLVLIPGMQAFLDSMVFPD